MRLFAAANRNRFSLKISPFFLIILLLFFSCGAREKWHSATLLYFDTVCEVQILCLSNGFDLYQKEIHRVFKKIEKYFSPTTTEYSSPIVLELYRDALQFYKTSDGFFDITVGPLSRLWELSGKENKAPAPDLIDKILPSIGMDKIRIENETLLLLSKMKLDWGSIAKGFGIDLASSALIKMGISRGFINAGGDLYCWGKNPSRRLWKVGIKHPRKQGYLGVLSISDLGVATTGDYQRYFEINNIRYHHVLDPHTGYPSRGKQSVTVIGPKTMFCDSLSTALFVSPNPETIINQYPEYGAIIVDSDGKVSRFGKTYPFALH